MQSGGAKGMRWRLDWDILPGGGRWENPLMGWASSYAKLPKHCIAFLTSSPPRADYVQGTRLSFRSKEDAIHFAEKQGMSPPKYLELY
jgi:NADH dehydrogenase (ubiquinone) Fe-S protein 4